jgi:rare lipoprotein A
MAQCGTASWYHEGAVTANGEAYRPDGISAAHRHLPFGTKVKVTHNKTGRSVIVRINDRGPFIGGRIIDLSRGAKRVIGMGGLASVCLEVIGRGQRSVSAKKAGGKRVAAKIRKAKQRTASRTVYRTTQTSARLDDAAEPARKRRTRTAKRSHSRKAAVRQQNRETRQVQRAVSSFKVAGWPRANDATF